jgi:16S rRNA (guanine527-N7)-methyltransferase
VSAFEARLTAVLDAARELGLLGPGPVASHIEHARGFVACVDGSPASFADLGTGGGVPGLVVAQAWPGATGILVESAQRRARFLREALDELGLAERITVVEARAETVAQDSQYRERFAVVTARGFGEPAVTAEIAAGLVEVGGSLVVSEPPEPEPDRWPPTELAVLGFAAADSRAVPAQFVVIRKLRPAPTELPRGVGRPAKRPRWRRST